MPLPTSLVVKKGSKTRAEHLGRHAAARVAHRDGARSRPPCRRAAAGSALSAVDADRAAAGHRVARVDAQVEQRELELAGVDLDRPQLGAEVASRPGCRRAATAFEQLAHAAQLLLAGRSASGCSGWRRENASSWWVSRVPRSTARRMPRRAAARRRRRGALRCSAARRWMDTVSRLLKSCATPPVSWPDRLQLLRLAQRVLGLS